MKVVLKTFKDQSGQMAILVMLVLVVALTIGLTILTRTLTNIKQSTITDESNRAYSAAEAGIEEALRGGITYNQNTTIGSGANNATFIVSSPAPQGNSTTPFAFANPLEKDEAQQVWLFDYNDYRNNNTINLNTAMNHNQSVQLGLYWGNSTTINATTPALEVSFIYQDNSGNFGIDKCALDPNSTRGNNFDNASTSMNGTFCRKNSDGALSIQSRNLTTSQGSKTYGFRKMITLDNAATMSNPKKNYLLVRLKTLYNTSPQEVAVDPNGATLVAQGQIIDSQGTAGDAVRKIRVYQSYPTLPGIFDYVLFNGSTNPLAK